MPEKNIAVLISGSGTNLQALIDAVKSGRINGKIKIIISNNKEAYGLKRASNEGIKGFYLGNNSEENKEDEILLEILKKENIDLIVLAGYLKILSENIVDKYKNKIINIHPSLIPSFCGKNYYGIKVHKEAVDYGVKISGATTHFVDEKTDSGPIIMQKTVKVNYEDTAEILQKKVLKIEHEILVETVMLFCDDKIKVDGRKVKIK